MKEKDYIVLGDNYDGFFETYSDEEVGRLVKAMLRYRSSGETPDFTGNERYIWPAIQRDLDN